MHRDEVEFLTKTIEKDSLKISKSRQDQLKYSNWYHLGNRTLQGDANHSIQTDPELDLSPYA